MVNLSKRVFKLVRILSLVVVLILLLQDTALAQCPMCKIAVESNLKGGGTAGKGLNAGILYLLVTPYFIIGSIAYIWWRNKRRVVEE
jgi:type III secretory pathway component EscU